MITVKSRKKLYLATGETYWEHEVEGIPPITTELPARSCVAIAEAGSPHVEALRRARPGPQGVVFDSVELHRDWRWSKVWDEEGQVHAIRHNRWRLRPS